MNLCKMHQLLYNRILSTSVSPRVVRTFCSRTPLYLSNKFIHSSKIVPNPEHVLKHHSQVLTPSIARSISLFGSDSDKNPWAKAVSEAEKLVGYPTSFMSLRCLLSDELANVALQVRKLVGTKHPLVQTAKNFVYDGQHSLQTRGLVVLLISKAASAGGTSPSLTNDQITPYGIHASQRALAEIVEMIHTAFLVHEGVVNLRDIGPEDGMLKDMDFGNKMAVLSGDFLLATACMGLAQLQHPKTVEIIAETITHMTQGAFTNIHAKTKKLSFEEWKNYVYLSSGSLIGQSCRAALQLANHVEGLCDAAFEFGRNLAWAKQLHHDATAMSKTLPDAFPDIFAPVILYNEFLNWDGVPTDEDPQKMLEALEASPAMDRMTELNRSFADTAVSSIRDFPSSDAKKSLQKIVEAVKL